MNQPRTVKNRKKEEKILQNGDQMSFIFENKEKKKRNEDLSRS